VVDDAHFIAKFVQRHATVKAAFKRIVEKNKSGLMPRLLPETRFVYADLLCSTVMGGADEANIVIYETMINEVAWETNTAKTVNAASREKFKMIVNSKEFYLQVRCLRQLTGPICKAIHEMESSAFHASYLMSIFLAIERDVENWCKSTAAIINFDNET